MKIPVHLKHKPVIVSEAYDTIDGRKSVRAEAKGLSLGIAQWSTGEKVDISAKIWRHTGDKWSRQSEEMPLHRVLDLAILVCKTHLIFKERRPAELKQQPDYPVLDSIDVQEGALNVAVCEESERGE